METLTLEHRHKSGIYIIRNSVNSKIYIGSASCLYSRRRDHLKSLKNGSHKNLHLLNHYKKYGECFYFEVIELCNQESLIEREQYYIDLFKSYNNNGFNICRKAGSLLGYRHTEETRKGWSEKRKGYKHSNDTKSNMSLAQRGSNHAQTILTEADVIKIRSEHDGGFYTSSNMAKEYNVSWNIINRIIKRHTWKHI